MPGAGDQPESFLVDVGPAFGRNRGRGNVRHSRYGDNPAVVAEAYIPNADGSP
jgi:hypothetical protein